MKSFAWATAADIFLDAMLGIEVEYVLLVALWGTVILNCRLKNVLLDIYVGGMVLELPASMRDTLPRPPR